MPSFLVNALPGMLMALFGLLLGAVAYRHTNTRQLSEIQDKVIAAYKEESEAQSRRIEECRSEITRVNLLLETVMSVLAQQGMLITIVDDTVTIEDRRREQNTRTVTRRKVGEKGEKKDGGGTSP